MPSLTQAASSNAQGSTPTSTISSSIAFRTGENSCISHRCQIIHDLRHFRTVDVVGPQLIVAWFRSFGRAPPAARFTHPPPIQHLIFQHTDAVLDPTPRASAVLGATSATGTPSSARHVGLSPTTRRCRCEARHRRSHHHTAPSDDLPLAQVRLQPNPLAHITSAPSTIHLTVTLST